MTLASDKTRIYVTVTKIERQRIKDLVASRLAEGFKATESSVTAELIRFALASRVPVRND